MAKKITDLTDKRPVQVKKSVAMLLIRRLLAVWVVENVSIRRLPVGEIPAEARSIRIRPENHGYIPTKLPPVEVGGCVFEEPLIRREGIGRQENRRFALVAARAMCRMKEA